MTSTAQRHTFLQMSFFVYDQLHNPVFTFGHNHPQMEDERPRFHGFGPFVPSPTDFKVLFVKMLLKKGNPWLRKPTPMAVSEVCVSFQVDGGAGKVTLSRTRLCINPYICFLITNANPVLLCCAANLKKKRFFKLSPSMRFSWIQVRLNDFNALTRRLLLMI